VGGAALGAQAEALRFTLAAAIEPPPVVLPFGSGAADALTFVFLAEGFTAADLPDFRATVDAFLARLAATAPYDQFLPALAALRVDTVSPERGIDDPDAGLSVDTPYGGRFGRGAMRRLIEVDQGKAVKAAKTAAGSRRAFVGVAVVNTTEYGGSGGKCAVFSRNALAADIALHELGHTLFGLADEYSGGGGVIGNPSEPNVTKKPASGGAWGANDQARLKWRALLTPGLALPTVSNPDCSQPFNPPPQAGVGAFEGGKYLNCGVWRPAADCKMRTLTADFCPVCRQVIADKLATYL
jgi:hypothetical protein